MKNEKPNFEDYGITMDEYNNFCEAQLIFEEKHEKSTVIFISILEFIGVWLAADISASLFMASYYNSSFSEMLYFLYKDKSLGEIIGIILGFVIAGLIIGSIRYKRHSSKIDKKFESKLAELGFNYKKIEMLNRYQQDFKNYKIELNEILRKKDCLKKELRYIQSLYFERFDNNEFKNLLHSYYPQYEEYENDIFDFKFKNNYIKCIGADSFISNIEIKEMISEIKNYKSANIIIYTLSDIKIPQNEKITVIDKNQFKEFLINIINLEIKKLEDFINK